MHRVAHALMPALLVAASLSSGGCDRTVAGGRADGAEIFAKACARCHGPGGQPDPGMVAKLGVKDLTRPSLQQRLSDEEIRNQILNGSKNKQMPSFEGALSEEQTAAVIDHVRSLEGSKAKARE